jgi:hypothetical protein
VTAQQFPGSPDDAAATTFSSRQRVQFATLAWACVLVIVAGRVSAVVYTGLERNRGDFYATLPGAYVESLNPALWNSPDLTQADGFGRSEYLYGPTQYLTVFPLLFLDSYQAVATVLLGVYFALILLAAELMWRSVRLVHGPMRFGRPAVYASTWLFLPVLQAYTQREFEIVILFISACALYMLVRRRDLLAGALLGYAAWFKFFPLVFLPYFAARGMRRAALAFVAASVVVIGMAATLLGLSRFAPVVELASGQMQKVVASDFCEVWSRPETRHHAVANNTRAGIKWALCSFEDRWAWFSAPWVYGLSVALLLAIVGLAFLRLERHPMHDDQLEGWRRMLEVSLLLIAPWFLYAHYYYLASAIIPLNALLLRYVSSAHTVPLAPTLWLWAAAYLLLGAFVLPVSVLSQLLDTDYWRLYMRYNTYFFGQALLLILIVWEYARLSRYAVGLTAPVATARAEREWTSPPRVLQPQTRTSAAVR